MNEQENKALAKLPVEDEAVLLDFQSQSQKDTELNIHNLEDDSAMRGTLIDFLDHIQGGLKSQEESIETSSTIEEIQEQQAHLKYRRDWLKALLNETDKEIERISQIIESKE